MNRVIPREVPHVHACGPQVINGLLKTFTHCSSTFNSSKAGLFVGGWYRELTCGAHRWGFKKHGAKWLLFITSLQQLTSCLQTARFGEGWAEGLKTLLTAIAVDPKTWYVRTVLGSLSLLGAWPQLSILHDQLGASRALYKAPSSHSKGSSLASPWAPASLLHRHRSLIGFPFHGSSQGASSKGRRRRKGLTQG